MRRPRIGLWTVIMAVCIATSPVPTSAEDSRNELITLWQEAWVSGTAIDPEVVEILKADSVNTALRLITLLDQTPLRTAEYAVEALQQVLDGQALDVLIWDALAHDDAQVRSDAARALGILYRDGLVTDLLGHLQHERNQSTLQFLATARTVRTTLLPGNVTPEAATRLLGQALSDRDRMVRRRSAEALTELIGRDDLDSVLIDSLSPGDAPMMSEIAAWGLRSLGIEEVDATLAWLSVIDATGGDEPEVVPAVATLLAHPVLQVAWQAAEIVSGRIQSGTLVDVLSGALESQQDIIRWAAAESLAQMADGYDQAVATRVGSTQIEAASAVPALVNSVDDESVQVRRAVLRALDRLANEGVGQANQALINLANDLSGPEDTRAAALRVVARSGEYELTTSQRELMGRYEKRPVFTRGTEGYHTFRIPSAVVSPSGTLLVFAEGRKNSQSDTGDIDLVLKRSFDNGLTWQPLQVVWDSGPNTSGNPVPVVDQHTGRIWLFMTHNLGVDTQAQIQNGTSRGVRTIWVSYSDDDGATWSEPENLFDAVQDPWTRWDATGPATGIQLEHGPNQGRLIIPAIGRIIYSDDHGATWHQGGRIEGTSESQVVELADGRLLRNDRAVARSVPNRRPLAYSDDQGLTWGPIRYARELITTYSQGSTIAYRDPAQPDQTVLLFSNPATAANVDQVTGARGHGARVNMTVRISRDQGASWTPGKTIHRGPSGYSSLAVLSDSSIGLVFEGGRKHTYEHIYFMQFSLDWLEDER